MGLTKAGKSTVNAGNTSPWTGVLDCIKRRKQATHQHPSLPPEGGCDMRYTDHLPHAHSSMTRSPQTVSRKSFLPYVSLLVILLQQGGKSVIQVVSLVDLEQWSSTFFIL